MLVLASNANIEVVSWDVCVVCWDIKWCLWWHGNAVLAWKSCFTVLFKKSTFADWTVFTVWVDEEAFPSTGDDCVSFRMWMIMVTKCSKFDLSTTSEVNLFKALACLCHLQIIEFNLLPAICALNTSFISISILHIVTNWDGPWSCTRHLDISLGIFRQTPFIQQNTRSNRTMFSIIILEERCEAWSNGLSDLILKTIIVDDNWFELFVGKC